MLVQAPRKVSIQQESIGNSLPYNPANKSEVAQMVGVDVAVCIWLESAPVFRRSEEGIIRIEDLLREDAKKFSRQSSGIDTLLVPEGDVQSTTHLLGIANSQLVVSVFKNMFASNM